MKLLIWAIIAFAVVSWLLKGSKRHHQSGTDRNHAGKTSSTAEGAESMLQCAQCGLHIPASEAVISEQGKVFCSHEHRLQMEKSAS